MRRGWVALCGAVLIGVLGGVLAPSALATNDPWFSGTLAPGLGFASAGAHSIEYIQGSGNFNGFCVAKDQGLSGYGSASRVPAGTPACATSGGFVARTENSACCYHGWISNGTSNDLVVDSTTFYRY